MYILDHRRGKIRTRRAMRAQLRKRERGQALLLITFAMIGLIVATGLAVDGGMLYLRKIQLNRAVDAAALTGVTQLSQGIAVANTHGQQMMAANGIVTSSGATCNVVNWNINDYCGLQEPGGIPGSTRYRVEAKYMSRTFFMRIIRIDSIPIRSTATAEVLPLVDLYASDMNEIGLVKTSNQSIFGPAQQTSFGDPYTSSSSTWYTELYGAYTYRVRIPQAYTSSKVRIEIFDPDTGNNEGVNQRTYGVDGSMNSPANCGDRRNACLLATPWAQAGANPNPQWFVHVDENRVPGGNPSSYNANLDGNTRTLFRLYYLRETADGTLEEVDLAYYVGKADSPNFASPTGQYTAAQAHNEARATDLHWVSPGVPAAERMPGFDLAPGDRQCVFEELRTLFGSASPNPPNPPLCDVPEPQTIVENCEMYRAANFGSPASGGYTQASRCNGNGDFIIDLTTEIPGIYVDPGSGIRDIYLQVRGITGASENGYEFWAGPPRSADAGDYLYTVPSGINARHIYLLAAKSLGSVLHRSNGINITGLGHLPMNSNIGGQTVDVALAYLGPEFAGQQITVQMFDPDAGALDPIVFYFDTIPMTDWSVCYDDNGGSSWSTCAALGFTRTGAANIPLGSNWQTPPYSITIPSDGSEGSGQPFYGGRLYARYQAGQDDTYGWKVEIESRPYLVR